MQWTMTNVCSASVTRCKIDNLFVSFGNGVGDRCDFDECLHLLAHFPPYENVDEVVASIRSVTLSLKKVKQTYVQCEADLIREHRGRIIKTAASDTARPSS